MTFVKLSRVSGGPPCLFFLPLLHLDSPAEPHVVVGLAEHRGNNESECSLIAEVMRCAAYGPYDQSFKFSERLGGDKERDCLTTGTIIYWTRVRPGSNGGEAREARTLPLSRLCTPRTRKFVTSEALKDPWPTR